MLQRKSKFKCDEKDEYLGRYFESERLYRARNGVRRPFQLNQVGNGRRAYQFQIVENLFAFILFRNASFSRNRHGRLCLPYRRCLPGLRQLQC